MGIPKLVWSPIQLILVNQYRTFLVGRVDNVQVDINGVRTTTNFEVIEIMDDKVPYLALLGIDWAFDK